MSRCKTVLSEGLAVLAGVALSAGTTAAQAQSAPPSAVSASPEAHCYTTIAKYAPLAKRMASDITERLRQTRSNVGLKSTDPVTGISCYYHSAWHFDSASVIKVTIIATLLREAQLAHRGLTPAQRQLAWLMITQSDNNAATALWNEAGGPAGIARFLRAAKMRQTILDPGGAWGLTRITAHDEVLLLQLISFKNEVLDKSSRIYIRYLMGHVIPSQRWGVPAGVPAHVGVHVKNGWLPIVGGWEINSIGTFHTTTRTYMMAILTDRDPTMSYGIYSIENIARVIHADLHRTI